MSGGVPGAEGGESPAPLGALLAQIIALYKENAASERAESAMLSRAVEILEDLAPRQPSTQTRRSLPVRRFRQVALLNAPSGRLQPLARALEHAEPSLDWLQNPNYTRERMGADFVEHYGYVELVGPGRAFESREPLVGFLLLGPQTLYPDHDHAAEETYHVVSGRAFWRRGDGAWRDESPGAIIHHAPHVPHAMRTEHEPLLALYCWMGDVATPADLLTEE